MGPFAPPPLPCLLALSLALPATLLPGAAAGPAPQTVALNSDDKCPFAKWKNATNQATEPRSCFECKWCPFRKDSCCEIEGEVDVLKSIKVSGQAEWDCFITIAHFQECGKCSPESRKYTVEGELSYIAPFKHAPGKSIRICKEACGYIYKRCKDAKLFQTDQLLFGTTTQEEFCKDAPESSTDGTPCYNSAGRMAPPLLLIALLAALALLLSV